MSPTIRVNERTKNAIESFQSEDQSMSEAIEEIVDELGLFGERRLNDFTDQLSTEYGLDTNNIEEVLRALRTVYIKREAKSLSSIPKDTVAEFESELGILTKLQLIETESFDDPRNGDVSSAYTLTESGETIASAAMNQHLTEQTSQLHALTQDFHPTLIAFLLHFGFHPTDIDHLSTSPSALENQGWISEPEIHDQYDKFLTRLLEDRFAIRNEWRENSPHSESPIVVLPPEFKIHLARVSDKQEAAIIEMEANNIVNEVIEDTANIKTRESILRTLTIADETHLKQHINQLHEEGFTSQYSQSETPFLVTDITGFRNHILSEIMEVIDE